MENHLHLKQKSDNHLILDLKDLVTKEREVLAQILHYLKEVESRRLYLTKGFSSMFAFLTEELGYSESAAQRRIQAMRLLRDLPEVEEKIEKGTLSLSVASQIQSFIQKENKQRQDDRLTKLTSEEKLNLVEKLEGTSARKCEAQLIQLAPETNLPKEKTKPLTPEKTLVQFLANPNLMRKINKLKNLLSHQNPESSLEKLFEKTVDLALDRLDPERRQARRDNRMSNKKESKTISPPTSKVNSSPAARGFSPGSWQEKRSRYIPQPLRDQVWNRDEGCCQYRDLRTGQLCGSQHLVEIDHKYPFAWGGESSEGNLRLRCRAHNRKRAGKMFEAKTPR